MRIKTLTSALSLVVLYLLNTTAFAQQPYATPPTPSSKHIMKEDSAAINALAMYPSNIRLDIFEACQYPAAIVNIASLQKTTSTNFAKLIGDYSKDEQEDFWDLSRYPDLITYLVRGGKKSREELNNYLNTYPENIRQTAVHNEREHFQILKRMDDIQMETNMQFEQILADYSRGTQDALRVLIQYPEIINLLNDHLNMTVRVGDHYRRDPQGVIAWVADINLAEERQNAEDAVQWKKTIEENPDAAADMKSASNEYAQENGYSEDEIHTSPTPDYVTNYNCTPYSYWFGYPTWYPYSYWYPYPFWFDCGFYYDAFGNMVVFGAPSFYFTNWFFYHPEHCHHHPHLGDVYVNHYYGHRRTLTGNGRVVSGWVRDNRKYLPADFRTNKTNRVEVIRQVGQMNEEARKQQGGKPLSAEARDQYFQKNNNKYPSLNSKEQPKTDGAARPENKQEILPKPESQPHIKIDRSTPIVPTRPQAPPTPVVRPNTEQTQPRNNNKFNNIHDAQEYHKNNWEQAQPSPRQQSQPAPRPSAPSRSAPSSRPSGGGGRK